MRRWRAFRVLGSGLLVGGCGGPLSTLDPAGPGTALIARLWWVMFWGSAAIFLLTLGLFALVMLRPRWGARVSAGRWIALGGLGLPALVLPPLAGYSLWIGEALLPTAERDAVRIEAEAAMWFWTFRYPDHGGGETIDILHLPEGEPVEIHLTSRDVIHSFWVPRLTGKRDNVPGQVNVVRLRADDMRDEGPIEGTCAEFCGIGHARMRFEVRVHPENEMEAAIAAEPQGDPPRVPGEPPAPAGLPVEPLR